MTAPTDTQGRVRWPAAGALDDSLAGTELADLLAEQQRLLELSAQLRRDEQQLQNADRTAAEEADRQAMAEAIRAGAKEPGPKHVTAWQERVDATKRRRGGLDEALAQVDREVQSKLRARGDAYTADAHDLEAQALAAVQAQVRELAAAMATYQQRVALVSWLHGNRRPHLPVVPAITNVAGQPLTAQKVTTDLAAAVEQWKR